MHFDEKERENLDRLNAARVDYAVLEPTANGLAKSTLDATALVREFLVRASVHDYDQQAQGPEHKVTLQATLVLVDGTRRTSRATLFRPRSKNGDPRIWFSGLKDLCEPGDKCAVLWDGAGFLLLNLTRGGGRALDFAIDRADPKGSGSDAAHWAAYGRLWERATGGSDVAARPDSGTSFWPTVPRAPGVDAAWTWLAEGVELSAPPRIVFLVGGPGAGKSHAASAIVERLGLRPREASALAERSYNYDVNGMTLTIVNDATIRSEDDEALALSRDIQTAIDRSASLLACVNRGVLVEEAAEIRTGGGGNGIGGLVVDWLHAGANERVLEHDITVREWAIRATSNQPYLHSAVITRNSVPVADLIVVFVDTCSLLEAAPSVSIAQTDEGRVELSAERYVIGDFAHTSERLATPGGALLGSVVAELASHGDGREDAQFLNPFVANELSLSQSVVRAGVLSVLRSAEIITGQRLTFRELWGAAVRLLVGNAPDHVQSDDAQSYVASLQPQSTDSVKRFREVRELAELRFSQALFGASGTWKHGAHDALRNPVTRITWPADPLRDSDPGEFDPDEPTSGWATPIADAFTGPVASGSPLETLVDAVAPEDPLRLAITAFDWAVDGAFVEAVQSDSITDAERFELIGWYGAYLTRLYAVSNGISAFRSSIASWAEVWHLSPAVPSHVASHLRTLLRPKKGDGLDSTSVIPVFDSRTYPIVGDVEAPRLALRSGDFELETHRLGERLVLRVLERGRVVSSVALDFALIRESAACIGNTMGITDVSDDVSPRLERFRSTRLTPSQVQSGGDYVVLSGARMTTLQIG